MKILLAVDGSEYSRRATNFVTKNFALLAQPPELHLLHVHAPIPYPGAAASAPKGAIEKYQKEDSEAALAVAQKELTAANLTAKSAWCVGDVAEEGARYVERHAIDLIVVGSHGRSTFAALALGSVAMKILATVKTPVLIVR